MFENPRRGRQAKNFTTNVPKILDLKSSSEQIFSRKLPLGAPVLLAININGEESKAELITDTGIPTNSMFFVKRESIAMSRR